MERVRSIPASLRAAGYLSALIAVAGCTALDFLLFPAFDLADLVMVYLVGVLAVASTAGTGPSVLASVLSVLAFDYCFVPPRFTFVVENRQHLLTFGVMLVAGLAIGRLTARVRDEAERSRVRERRTAALYSLSGELSAVRGTDALLEIAVRHITQQCPAVAVAMLPDPAGRLEIRCGAIAEFGLLPREVAVAQWSFETGQSAGFGTETLPESGALFIPLRASDESVGALGVRPAPAGVRFTPDQVKLIEAFANQTALAVASDRFAEANRRIEVQVEAERMRSSLLSSVSHDLRTPLAAIVGSASALLGPSSVDPEARRDLAENIRDEADRMARLVQNLLDMTRLERGAVDLRREPHHISDVIGSALGRLEHALGDRPVVTAVASDLPLVPMDAALIEQVLVNLVENALKYTPVDTPIEVAARIDRGRLTVAVRDRGPGIPLADLDQLFEKFYRGRSHGKAGGAGLGLAICKAAVAAHGGRIVAGNRDGGGAEFEWTIPAGEGG